jgi:glycine dehydrogenase
VTVDDVAKRLIDYGFHAPTMSFPVAGTLMIEPTESEDLAELDRFCDAMIADPQGDRRGRRRHLAQDDNPAARGAAHRRRADGSWSTPTPATCGLPRRASSRSGEQVLPPVRRIDGAYGDRNLVCSCPSPEAYEQ